MTDMKTMLKYTDTMLVQSGGSVKLTPKKRKLIDRIKKEVNILHMLYSTSTEAPTSYYLCMDILSSGGFQNIDWSDPNLRCLDPCVGRGNFLIALIEKCLPYHSIRHIVEKMIYGLDINRVQAEIARTAIKNVTGLDANIQQSDYEAQEWDMKFDVAVGNWPFEATNADGSRKDQASNLWSTGWDLALKEMTTDDAILAFVSPTSWLSPSVDISKGKIRLWDEFEKYDSLANISTVKDYFKGVGSTFGYVIVDKSGDDGLKFTDGVTPYDNWMWNIDKINVAEARGLSIQDVNDILKVQLTTDTTQNLGGLFPNNQNAYSDRVRVCIPLSKVSEVDRIEILQPGELPSSVSTKGKNGKVKSPEQDAKLYYYIECGEDQAEAVRDRIIECLDIINIWCRWSGFANIQTIKNIKL